MTIITKPLSEKKADKKEAPLVINEEIGNYPSKPDLEGAAETEPQYFVLRTRARRVSAATTICLFLTALLVMSIGIIAGVYLYRQFARSQVQRFRGWCTIPYEGTHATMYLDDRSNQNVNSDSYVADSDLFASWARTRDSDDDELNETNKLEGYFKEEFEMDLVNEDFEKIDVPEFKGGRRGRFVHDFNANKTGIVDLDSQRCFVMPLDRSRVLPPHSMLDLIKKMWNGYYEVDTNVVRETMRVVVPPIKDYSSVGIYIARECKNVPTYLLEKVTSPVFKRSVLENNAKFAEFAGKKILEVDLINMPEILEYEAQNLQGA
ncbi:integral membrane protein 2C [Schistocerca americana]|uniref:integral membrane protein 2C n=1 Tax=Schistocerca americana TaxID=7009 RepID=UPI001F4F2EF5|nr:integral membrane protein 2C [Schistocerca americana]XP_047114934.1 integral membrane protein 2C [Schistocerca piceifrons]XP_049785616.1 integral membrane protein 2C [Schistocerca cancellata]XP_049813374.1 integral membrane protein 2C [Schistocerca nitens]XP_049827951.1 integral membrane protein 2C [Schistocerca gregaria]XP_049961459.1 integral membrane protein 2C [Schistocerca serialis cubense]